MAPEERTRARAESEYDALTFEKICCSPGVNCCLLRGFHFSLYKIGGLIQEESPDQVNLGNPAHFILLGEKQQHSDSSKALTAPLHRTPLSFL